jgi:hypothetical protein
MLEQALVGTIGYVVVWQQTMAQVRGRGQRGAGMSHRCLWNGTVRGNVESNSVEGCTVKW